MDQPLISVIIPVYNTKEYLERCVASVCAQTYQNLEILLVDDGSTDGTGLLCDELAEKDARIRVFHKKNGGSSSARNLGISRARGEFLGFVDSDDYISREMYGLLLEGIKKFGARMAQVGRDEIDMEGNLLPNICEPPETAEFVTSYDFLRELLMHRGDCSFCTKLVDRRLLEKQQFPEGELNEDFKLMVSMLEEIEGIVSLPQQAYHVFYRIGSNTRKESGEEFSRVYGDCVNNANMAAEVVQKKYPGLQKEALRFGLFQRLEYLLHIPVSKMERENREYRAICRYVKKSWRETLVNPHLTKKNKVYLLLFAVAPRGIRVVHGWMKKIGR